MANNRARVITGVESEQLDQIAYAWEEVNDDALGYRYEIVWTTDPGSKTWNIVPEVRGTMLWNPYDYVVEANWSTERLIKEFCLELWKITLRLRGMGFDVKPVPAMGKVVKELINIELSKDELKHEEWD
jgi:hypothetical protein